MHQKAIRWQYETRHKLNFNPELRLEAAKLVVDQNHTVRAA